MLPVSFIVIITEKIIDAVIGNELWTIKIYNLLNNVVSSETVGSCRAGQQETVGRGGKVGGEQERLQTVIILEIKNDENE